MGIDLLDITFRIEKTFGFRITPDDWNQLVRKHDVAVGDLYGLILKRLNLSDHTRNDIGVNYHLWSEIQESLHLATGLPVEKIELGTPLESLFPEPSRRESWSTLREFCPYPIRELDYPMAVRPLGFALAAGVALIEQFHVWQFGLPNWFWPVLGIIGFWMFSETYLKILKICARFRTCLPSRLATVKDLCRTLFAANYREICERAEIAIDECSMAVWEQLVRILKETLLVEADEVGFCSRLIRDLGME